MVKVSFRYKPELVQWIKSAGAGSTWNREEKVWEVPEEILDGLVAKAKELGVEIKVEQGTLAKGSQLQPAVRPKANADSSYIEYDSKFEAGRPSQASAREDPDAQRGPGVKEGEIRLRRSRDGRFVLININLIAFSSDVEDLVKGTKSSVKFRVLPPPTYRQSGNE